VGFLVGIFTFQTNQPFRRKKKEIENAKQKIILILFLLSIVFWIGLRNINSWSELEKILKCFGLEYNYEELDLILFAISTIKFELEKGMQKK
jgi:hypothetical protein